MSVNEGFTSAVAFLQDTVIKRATRGGVVGVSGKVTRPWLALSRPVD